MLPDGTRHAVTGHNPVRTAMPLMVSPEHTRTEVVEATGAGVAVVVAPPSRWLTIDYTLAYLSPSAALRASPLPWSPRMPLSASAFQSIVSTCGCGVGWLGFAAPLGLA